MRQVAESFTWPFRGEWRTSWMIGVALILFLPLTFILVLGYAIAAVRAAQRDPAQGPPPWRLSARLVYDGVCTSAAILAVSAPFAIAYAPLVDRVPTSPISSFLVLAALALPWGLVLLALMPHCSARFATTGQWKDIFDFGGAVKSVMVDFAAWNTTVAAIVTAWAMGLACAGLLCVGAVPGLFYAILVSAHATAATGSPRPAPAAR